MSRKGGQRVVRPTTITQRILILVVLLLQLANYAAGVDHAVFKTCSQSSFCRRCRSLKPGASAFAVVDNTLTIPDTSTARLELVNNDNQQRFVLTIQALVANTFRVQVDEKQPLFERFRVEDSLQREPQLADNLQLISQTAAEITLTGGNGRVVIRKSPLRVDFYENEVLVVRMNGQGLMRFEHYREKPTAESEPGSSIEDTEPGSWEESFNGFVDLKPHGPEAIAMDFGFPAAKVLFGIPAHAESLALRSTASMDPYRLYNLDVAFHELDSPMSLYGAVPVLYGHGANRTAGIFWHNAAETWVDIANSTASSPLTANFMTESGIVDVFVMLGPRPKDVFRQYTHLTGVVPLPQQYTLAYHQCRWNYDNETDVKTVAAEFDNYDIPLDTMWLDIEYTDQKKYYTWDPVTFSQPDEMIANLSAAGRHLHVIIDIHIFHDPDYAVNSECIARNLYTKTITGENFIGDCWPGASGYPDVFTEEARDFMASRYHLENFPHTTKEVMIWNDMNEPSVFDGPEKTMPKTNLHYNGRWEHRHLHNQFGHMQLRSTHQGLLERGELKLRPFILTRSHFAGSQRYAIIWTGDNTADWGYLQVSIKMCLAEATAGFSFCGADVGGFFNEPTPELYARWYQAAAWTPFYRSHANLGTARREPWLFDLPTQALIRAAVKRRYTYLPLWYTLFFEHEQNGLPVMRPLLTEYPQEEAVFAMDHQFMLGDKLLVHPVMVEGEQVARVYLPNDLWYDIDTYERLEGAGEYVELPVTMDKTFVYQRGGTVVPLKLTERKASTLMREDPFTLIVCLDAEQQAMGTVYVDDGKSFEYRDLKFVYAEFKYAGGELVSRKIVDWAQFETLEVVQKIVVAGVAGGEVKTATVREGSTTVEYPVQKEGNTYVLSGTQLKINEEWRIQFNAAGLGRMMCAWLWVVVGAAVWWVKVAGV